MIVAENLCKTFGKVVAVDSINFRIPAGRVVGFLGPNGAGKTTTIRMIAGYLRPTQGTVLVNDVDVTRAPNAVRRGIGYMPESTPLYPEMRVIEYLRFRARLFGVRGARRRQSLDNVVRRCGLQDVRRRAIGHLSKGYRQRVGLAAALLHEPPVLILDEPTAGLDPSQIREVRTLIRELAGRHTILLSTHILPEVEQACDDIILISGGQVRAQGSVEKLLDAAAAGAPYIVETDGHGAARVLESLPSIDHVESKTLEGSWVGLTITPKPGADDRRELIFRTLKKQGASVRELRRAAPTLEQLFVQIQSGQRSAPTRATPASAPRPAAIPMVATSKEDRP